MELKDIQNAGSDILDAVTNAVSSGDYSNLSESIRKSVTTFAASAQSSQAQRRRQMYGHSQPGQGAYVYNEHLKGTTAQWRRPDSLRTYSKGMKTVTVNGQGRPVTVQSSGRQLPATPYFNQGLQRFSPYAGGVQLALGTVGCIGTGAVAIPCIATGLVTGVPALLITGAVFGAGLLASAFVAKKGLDKQRLFIRYRNYGRVIGDAEYIEIDELAHLSGVDRKRLLTDVETCRNAGYLTDTYVDAGETTLMVTRNAYDQYATAEKARLKREKEALAMKESLDANPFGAQVQQILTEGEDYLKTVRELNLRIPDAEMTRKISRIEELMARTFEEVKKQPGSAPSLRKYMSYYLPTTVKLLTAYADLDGKPEIGDNIRETKQEISSSLDMVGDAFEKLFDSLFEEMSWDISSDISVMKTMMAQDGLTEDSVVFRKPENEGGEENG